MQNNITLEVSAGILTFLCIVAFIVYQIVRFNKQFKNS